MHEISIAQALLEQIQEIVKKQKVERVLAIELILGPLSGVVQECLEFCFPAVVEGTLLEGVPLIFHQEPLKVQCLQCHQNSSPELPFLQCTHCNATNTKVIAGKEFRLKSLEVE